MTSIPSLKSLDTKIINVQAEIFKLENQIKILTETLNSKNDDLKTLNKQKSMKLQEKVIKTNQVEEKVKTDLETKKVKKTVKDKHSKENDKIQSDQQAKMLDMFDDKKIKETTKLLKLF